eukprot:TRINITY_DN10049_c0_g1_i1.p1 TRINITY_DN10049_c0_g1~~TRINITY_DN10049_c0_g1_i1.p1  ORF type:complete len:476 (+),score=59.01 TRINITY_DN10049_c0_g1_i1:72-1499(+)
MESRGGGYEPGEDLGGVNLKLALSLPGEKILWAKRVPMRSTFKRGAGVFGLAIAAPIIFLVLCICELIFVSVEGAQQWPQWVMMIFTLICVIVLYIVFLWNRLLGIRIDVVTNLRVVNIVVRSSASLEKSFLPLTNIDSVYAGQSQVTFNSKRPAFHISTDQDEEAGVRKPLIGGVKPTDRVALRGPHHSRLAIQFAHVDDPNALKFLVEKEKSKLYRATDATNPAFALMHHEWPSANLDGVPAQYRDLALPYLADGEKVLKIYSPDRYKRWIYGRRMPYVLGFSLWLLVFAFWIGDTHATDEPTTSTSGSYSITNNIAFLVIVVIFVSILGLGLPPLWIILDNAVDGVDCLLERSGVLFLRKGARKDLGLFCAPNAILASYDDIMPITLDRDEHSDSGYVHLRGLDNNSELVEVDNLSDFEYIMMQKTFCSHLRPYENASSSTTESTTTTTSSYKASSPEILAKYETADVYGEL